MKQPTAALPVVLLLVFATPLTAQVRFQKTYGGVELDYGFDILQTDDGGYIVAGETKNFGAGDLDAWLVRTDSLGDTLWTRTHGTAAPEAACALSAIPSGGWYVAGYGAGAGGYSDVWVLKVDANGDTVWTRMLQGQYNDYAWSVATTGDGGCIVAGQTESYGAGYVDAWLIKFEADGDTAWTETHGAPDKWDIFYSVTQAPDGGYILGGANYPAGGREDAWLLKTDAAGGEVWSHTYSGASGAYEDFREVINVPGGGFAACGSWGGKVSLARIDASGDTAWTRQYSGNSQLGYGMARCSDDGFVLVGSAVQDAWLIRTDTDGDTVWTRRYGGSLPDDGRSVIQAADGGYVLTGFTRSFGAGWFDLWIIKTDPNGSMAIAEPGPAVFSPVPVATIGRGALHLPEDAGSGLVLLDVSGRRVAGLRPGENDLHSLAPGIYFVRPRGDGALPSSCPGRLLLTR